MKAKQTLQLSFFVVHCIFYLPTPTNLNYLNSSITQAMYLHTDTVYCSYPSDYLAYTNYLPSYPKQPTLTSPDYMPTQHNFTTHTRTACTVHLFVYCTLYLFLDGIEQRYYMYISSTF